MKNVLEKFLRKRAKELGIPEEIIRELIPQSPEVGVKVIELLEKYHVPQNVLEKALKSKDPVSFLEHWIKEKGKPPLKS